MLRRASIATVSLGLLFSLSAGCKKEDTSNPDEGSDALLGPNMAAAPGSDAGDVGSDEYGGADDSLYADTDEGIGDTSEAAAADDRPKLPPKAEPKERCRGKGSKRTCSLVDPKPKVSAAYGVRTLMGDFRWGMPPGEVVAILSKDIEAEYAKRQKEASGAMDQDRNRAWRAEQIQSIKANHVPFSSASRHKWGVSLIQYEYEDDAGEEMIWVKASPNLRKFYFFKDGGLWKVLYAYSTDTWSGMSYEEVQEDKFNKWFGPSPTEKVKKDEQGRPEVTYAEWQALDGETVRAFNMSEVHGVYVVSVIDSKVEERIGERLPNKVKKKEFTDSVSEVLGSGDVCYNKEGDIVTCDNPSGYVD